MSYNKVIDEKKKQRDVLSDEIRYLQTELDFLREKVRKLNREIEDSYKEALGES